jgi:hypothetical protein
MNEYLVIVLALATVRAVEYITVYSYNAYRMNKSIRAMRKLAAELEDITEASFFQEYEPNKKKRFN